MKEKFIALLTFTSSLKNFGIKFIRVAILVGFVVEIFQSTDPYEYD